MSNLQPEEMGTTFEDARDTASKAGEKLTETANRGKERIQELGRNVQSKIDEKRAASADKLQTAASAIHEKAGNLPGGERVANFAHRTADQVQATSDYVREHDVQDMMTDAGRFVRRHPGPSMVAAAVAGFLIGRKLRSGD